MNLCIYRGRLVRDPQVNILLAAKLYAYFPWQCQGSLKTKKQEIMMPISYLL